MDVSAAISKKGRGLQANTVISHKHIVDMYMRAALIDKKVIILVIYLIIESFFMHKRQKMQFFSLSNMKISFFSLFFITLNWIYLGFSEEIQDFKTQRKNLRSLAVQKFTIFCHFMNQMINN